MDGDAAAMPYDSPESPLEARILQMFSCLPMVEDKGYHAVNAAWLVIRTALEQQDRDSGLQRNADELEREAKIILFGFLRNIAQEEEKSGMKYSDEQVIQEVKIRLRNLSPDARKFEENNRREEIETLQRQAEKIWNALPKDDQGMPTLLVEAESEVQKKYHQLRECGEDGAPIRVLMAACMRVARQDAQAATRPTTQLEAMVRSEIPQVVEILTRRDESRQSSGVVGTSGRYN